MYVSSRGAREIEKILIQRRQSGKVFLGSLQMILNSPLIFSTESRAFIVSILGESQQLGNQMELASVIFLLVIQCFRSALLPLRLSLVLTISTRFPAILRQPTFHALLPGLISHSLLSTAEMIQQLRTWAVSERMNAFQPLAISSKHGQLEISCAPQM
jgi:hypothetical protein